MPEAQASLVKPRHCPTAGVRTTEDSALALRPQRVAKPSQNQRASECPQDSVCVSWLAFIDGLRVVAEKCCLGLPRTVRSVSAGRDGCLSKHTHRAQARRHDLESLGYCANIRVLRPVLCAGAS